MSTDLTPDGMTRPRRIARGPRREWLTNAGWSEAQEWGLRTVIDLRDPAEQGRTPGDPVAEQPSSVKVFSLPIEDHGDPEFARRCLPILDSPAYWRHHVEIQPERIARVLRAVVEAGPGTLVHCSAGRDRTGLVSALLLANAGVPAESIFDDYAESVRAMAGRTPGEAPSTDRQAAWDADQVRGWLVQARKHVLDFVEAAPRHLDSIGLTPTERHALAALLI